MYYIVCVFLLLLLLLLLLFIFFFWCAVSKPYPFHSFVFFTMSIETLSFHVLRENQPIPMRDGVILYGDLYLPAIDGVVEEGRKW